MRSTPPKYLRYRGALYRAALTRDDVYWQGMAEIAERIVEIAESENSSTVKRELAQEALEMLKTQSWKIGIW